MKNGREDTRITDDRWYCSRIDAFSITVTPLNELGCWMYSCSHIDLTSVMCVSVPSLVLDWPSRKENDWVLSWKLITPTVPSLQCMMNCLCVCVGGVMSLKEMMAAHTIECDSYIFCHMSSKSSRDKWLSIYIRPERHHINIPHQEATFNPLKDFLTIT